MFHDERGSFRLFIMIMQIPQNAWMGNGFKISNRLNLFSIVEDSYNSYYLVFFCGIIVSILQIINKYLCITFSYPSSHPSFSSQDNNQLFIMLYIQRHAFFFLYCLFFCVLRCFFYILPAIHLCLIKYNFMNVLLKISLQSLTYI